MQFLAGLFATLALFVFANVWNITFTLMLYVIWRELRLLRTGSK